MFAVATAPGRFWGFLAALWGDQSDGGLGRGGRGGRPRGWIAADLPVDLLPGGNIARQLTPAEGETILGDPKNWLW